MKRLIGAVALAGILVTGCGEEPQDGGGGFQRPPTAVETVKVVPQQVADKFESVGNIEAGESVTMVSEIDGVLVKIPFREGNAIARGDLIAQLDDAQLLAEVRREEAVLAQRKASYDRVKDVVDQGAGAPQDLDDAAAVLKVAEADVALAKVRFSKTRITAPFDGMVGVRKVSVGAFVRPGQSIAELAQVSTLRVFFSVPERYLSKLQRGSEVKVSTTAYPGYVLTGHIDVVEPALDEKTRSVRVMVRLDNPGEKFRPGMSADVSAVLSERAEALTVPNEAVFVSGSDAFVFVVKADSTVTRRALVLGTRMADVVEVTSGLLPHEVVVKAGHQKLYETAKVMPVQSQEANTP
ncbi:MAG: membrane fusion protein (multidrug efflux system) [Candidatus Latescibacterota bacterium]|jgi:membrane fusion protein (multidrug efflux system)